jgi:Bacterial PH domain
VTVDRPVLRFTTTAKASADARALAQSGLARLDLVVDSAALLFAAVLAFNDAVPLAALVAVIAILSLLGSRLHPLQRALLAIRFRSILGRTTEVRIEDDGLHYSNPLATSFIPWSSITTVKSNSQTVAFLRGRLLITYLPSIAFESAVAQADAVAFARERIATPAR